MALITIVGFPCSGKSRRAKQLAEDFRKRLADPEYAGPKLQVVVVDDESSHVPRSSYDGRPDNLRYRQVDADKTR